MKLVKVGAAVLNQTPLAWDANKQNILNAIEAARQQAITVLCLPEMCINGYGCEDAYHSSSVPDTSMQMLREIAPETRGMIVSLGLPVSHHHAVYSAAALVADGQILGFTCKQFLAGDGVYYEPRWFKAWPTGARSELHDGDDSYPIGDLTFECDDLRIGFEICEDAWVAQRPGSNLSQSAVDLILNPSASHFAFGKLEVRKRITLEGSRAFGVTYVYTNLLGCEAGRMIYDGGALIAHGGDLIAAGPRLGFERFVVTGAVVDVDSTRSAQSRIMAFDPDVGGDERVVSVPFELPTIEPEWREPTLPAWEVSPNIKEEELSRAVALGLYDYMRKSRCNGFVVSLSGGVDSASVAALVALMVRFGVAELGLERFRGRLDHIPELDAALDERQLISTLLTTAYQATANSSTETRNAAREVAAALGATHYELDVEPIVQSYISLVSNAVGRKLDWGTDDITLQNIQARTRSPAVWMLANLRGALLLTTSNRSEAAVGYATMDGDTSGGLSPIGGIDKAFLMRWLHWLEKSGPFALSPYPALAAVNAQPPTAELRPPEAQQTDEDDLMPYDVLDIVERLAILDKRAPLEVFRIARARFPEHSTAQLGFWVERFFRLWCRNQWKRERYAPSFHLDDENLDPKTWCRFPILSGGYERELAELRAYLESNAA